MITGFKHHIETTGAGALKLLCVCARSNDLRISDNETNKDHVNNIIWSLIR